MSILVIAEQSGGHFKKATLAAVTAARQIASRTGLPWNIAVLGSGVADAARAAAGFGAARVLVADHASLAEYLSQPYAAAAADIALQSRATYVLAASTSIGKDLLPRVAVRLGAGLASDVVRLGGDGADVRFVRPMWAGNVLAEVSIETAVRVASIRGSDWDAAAPAAGTSEIVPMASAGSAASAAAGKMRFVRFDAVRSERPELTEASVVIAGGRGLKSAENFHILDELADSLGGAIGASRAAVDSGYAPNDYQIGQTGKSVAPNLYVAVAISGAIQHLAGMKNSKVIVAINKDVEAPIFQVADYGLVADAFKAVPEMAAAVRAIKA